MSTENTWKSQAGFIWSLIGSAVGFANILSFSAKAYKNGGGAYLIPYIIALFVIGIPFLILEGKIGQRWKSPLVTVYGFVWRRFGKIVGWVAVLACLTIGAFYIVLTGYAIAYTWFSAASQIPADTKNFFLHDFLKLTPELSDAGTTAWPIFLATCAVALISWLVLRRPVRSGIERICSIFMPLMVVMMVAFAITVCCLPGGLQGWSYYLKPSFEKLLDFSLWRDVFGQLFFSLSLGLGIVVGYSRYTGEKVNVGRAMISVAIGDFIVSFISGIAIFGCLAHISHTQGIPFHEILTTDSTFEIGFILFPKILKFFGAPLTQIIGGLFFFCVFIAGITGVFSIVESIAGNVEVEMKLARKKSVAATLCLLLAFSWLFCRGNGSHLIDALAPMVLGTNMLIGGLVLLFAFSKKPWFKWTAVLILGTILAGNLWQECSDFNLAKIFRWTWLFVACLAAIALSYRRRQEEELVA